MKSHQLDWKLRFDATHRKFRLSEVRTLIVIKPELEECFLRSSRLVGLESTLSPNADELRRRLGRERSRDHEAFRRELLEIYRLGKERRVRTFIEEIDLLRKVLHA